MRRRTIAMLAVGATVGAMLAPGTAPASPQDRPGGTDRQAMQAGIQAAAKTTATKAPTGANPFLALLPDPAKADYAGWRNWLDSKARQRAAAKAELRALRPHSDAGRRGRAGRHPRLQRHPRDRAARSPASARPPARTRGRGCSARSSPEAVTPTDDRGRTPRTTARSRWPATPASAPLRRGITTSGTIGDGPHGSAGAGTGDFDFYKLTARGRRHA